MYTVQEIAEALGLMTTGGKPHSMLVNALIKEAQSSPVYIENGTKPVYSPDIMPELLRTFGKMVHYELPEVVTIQGRNYRVKYTTSKRIH